MDLYIWKDDAWPEIGYTTTGVNPTTTFTANQAVLTINNQWLFEVAIGISLYDKDNKKVFEKTITLDTEFLYSVENNVEVVEVIGKKLYNACPPEYRPTLSSIQSGLVSMALNNKYNSELMFIGEGASLSQNPAADAISWYGPTHAASHITDDSISEASKNLPGVDQVVMCPCNLPDFWQGNGGHWCRWKTGGGKIWSIIQHLNDVAGWSRESIADWLDDLHDKGIVNIEFQPWDEGEENEQDAREG